MGLAWCGLSAMLGTQLWWAWVGEPGACVTHRATEMGSQPPCYLPQTLVLASSSELIIMAILEPLLTLAAPSASKATGSCRYDLL